MAFFLNFSFRFFSFFFIIPSFAASFHSFEDTIKNITMISAVSVKIVTSHSVNIRKPFGVNGRGFLQRCVVVEKLPQFDFILYTHIYNKKFIFVNKISCIRKRFWGHFVVVYYYFFTNFLINLSPK